MSRLRLLPTLIVASVGALLGLGFATFQYAEGGSYLSKDPAACANCHIMQPQYDSWQTASHHTVATCADCHLPADFPFNLIAKSVNGWNHSKAFTMQDFPEPVRITPYNAESLQENCRRCHADFVHTLAAGPEGDVPRCVRCHASVGHGEPTGLGGPLREGEVPRRGRDKGEER